MQKALNRQFKADKKAAQEKMIQQEHERQEREDELRAMARKIRMKERERREKEREEWERQYSRQSRSPSPRYSECPPGRWVGRAGWRLWGFKKRSDVKTSHKKTWYFFTLVFCKLK